MTFDFRDRLSLPELSGEHPKPLRIHMIGIGGIGMAGLARLLLQCGHHVQGSEQTANDLIEWLRAEGAQIHLGHDPALVTDVFDLVIRTTAVPLSHPECLAAVEKGLPLMRRGEVLPQLLHKVETIAVTGTHGKTTTTAMIVHLLRSCGMNPGYFVGGESAQLGAVADLGDGRHMIVEADESDGTLVNYRPKIAVVTNIEFDHMEHFADEAEMLACFRTFLSDGDGQQVVYCRDDEQATRLCSALPRSIGYGFSADADLALSDYEAHGAGAQVEMEGRAFNLPVAGRHNALNALAALAVGRFFHSEASLEGLKDFQAVDRRFQRVADNGSVTVISDYAHHPTEIQATLAIAQGLGAKRTIGIYQPHRFSRTQLLGDLFPPAFVGLDHLVLCPVYAASEASIKGGTHHDLGQKIQAYGETACTLVEDLDEAWAVAVKELAGEGLLLILGAGDVVELTVHAIEAFGQ